MNSTNRVLNRIVLLVGGVLFAIAGIASLLWATRPAWAEGAMIDAELFIDSVLTGSMMEIPGVGAVPVALIAALAIALVLAVVLVVFAFARGGGSVDEVASVRAEAGRTDVDRNVVDAVISGALAERPDVLSARTGVYLVGGRRTVRLAVTVRQGASLGDVLAAAERAIADWDSLLGGEDPILIHFTDRGWLGRYRSAARVQ